jgi:hypothetical protein
MTGLGDKVVEEGLASASRSMDEVDTSPAIPKSCHDGVICNALFSIERWKCMKDLLM